MSVLDSTLHPTTKGLDVPFLLQKRHHCAEGKIVFVCERERAREREGGREVGWGNGSVRVRGK
jgi:hypothetical protein